MLRRGKLTFPRAKIIKKVKNRGIWKTPEICRKKWEKCSKLEEKVIWAVLKGKKYRNPYRISASPRSCKEFSTFHTLQGSPDYFSFSFGRPSSLLPTAFRMNKIPFPSVTGKIANIQEICFKISMQRKMRNEKNPFSLHFPYRQQPLLAFLDSIWSARFLRQAACAFWHYIRLHYIFGECGF